MFDFRLLGYVRFAGCVQRSVYAGRVDVRLSKLSVRPQVQGLSKPLSCWSAFNERSENFSPVADSRRDGRVGWSKFGNPWLSDGQLVDWIIQHLFSLADSAHYRLRFQFILRPGFGVSRTGLCRADDYFRIISEHFSMAPERWRARCLG